MLVSRKFSFISISVLELLVNEHQQPVIELGVGNGRDAIYFARHGIKLVGIDQSTTAIEVCEAICESNPAVFSIL